MKYEDKARRKAMMNDSHLDSVECFYCKKSIAGDDLKSVLTDYATAEFFCSQECLDCFKESAPKYRKKVAKEVTEIVEKEQIQARIIEINSLLENAGSEEKSLLLEERNALLRQIKPSRKVGRPAKKPLEKRDVRVTVGLSPLEFERLEAVARKEGTHPAGLAYLAVMEKVEEMEKGEKEI
jgi:hypothetical protein